MSPITRWVLAHKRIFRSGRVNRTPGRQPALFSGPRRGGTLPVMSGDELQVVAMTAVEAREHVRELEGERFAALSSGVAEIDTYRRDLEAEIATWREFYVTAAVTEIATLRAELSGANAG